MSSQARGNLSESVFRRAVPEDYAAILQLQSANYIAKLSDEERKEGFLSAQFTLEQTAQIAEDLGTTVAVVDQELAGFLCAFRREFDTGSPVIAKMLDSYDRITFEGVAGHRQDARFLRPDNIRRQAIELLQ